jgi:Zn-dependent protease with chaperone function
MTNEQFEALVRRREAESVANPASYRNKVLWLGALGYAYILFLLVGTLGLIALLVVLLFVARALGGLAIKGVIALGFFAVVVLRALWVTFPKPDGVTLTPSDAPELWAAVDRLRSEMSAPPFHQILLTGDYNAAVVQRPLLGIFGWQQNFLLVGLPLLHTLTKQQFDSVIAHEMGHLRGGHSKFSGWVYRVNATWAQLLERLKEGGGANAIISVFFKWYAPQFAAYSFPLRRQDEYEADRAAAESVGREPTVAALSLIPVWDTYLSRTYWKPFYRRVHDCPAPPAHPFADLIAHPIAPALIGEARVQAERSLGDALREETTFADSHPALTDRIRALGGDAILPQEAPQETALSAYFSRNADALAQNWTPTS